jgi:hypothetical protein
MNQQANGILDTLRRVLEDAANTGTPTMRSRAKKLLNHTE